MKWGILIGIAVILLAGVIIYLQSQKNKEDIRKELFVIAKNTLKCHSEATLRFIDGEYKCVNIPRG